jgi:hypothetical protein
MANEQESDYDNQESERWKKYNDIIIFNYLIHKIIV